MAESFLRLPTYREIADCIPQCLGKASGITGRLLNSFLEDHIQDRPRDIRAWQAELDDNRIEEGLVEFPQKLILKDIIDLVVSSIRVGLEVT